MTSSNETPETETTEGTPTEPEPIDAEFEPADGPEPEAEKPVKSGIGMATLAAWSIGAALAGGTIGVIGSGSTNIDTAKFAPAELETDLKDLSSKQGNVSEKLDKAWETLSVTEARLEGQVEKLNAELEAREESQALLQSEFDALVAQLDALVGSSGDTAKLAEGETATAAGNTGDTAGAATIPPLQRLMTRITYLEERLAESDASPETSGQLKRALTDVSARVESLEDANDEVQRAMTKREEALASLQAGLFNANQAIADVEDRVVELAKTKNSAPESASTSDVEKELAALREQVATLGIASTAKEQPVPKPTSSASSGTTPETKVSPTPQDSASTGMAPVQPASSDTTDTQTAKAAKQISDAALAMSALESQSARGKPFPSAWDRLDEAMPDNANVQAIKSISRRGAPPLSDLRTSFADVNSVLNKRIQDEGKGDGLDWARRAFGGVVSVRRTDVDGDTPEAVLNRIRNALDDADLTTAIENADLLEGFSDTEFDEWLTAARARLTLDTNVAAVREEILDKSAELSGRN